ncbi:hypothetical protein [Acetobacter tropicalis]|uniref:hypothetical protein n=1 Tax=Acetobacter tropicalis TaxID=104102 RepID=UPI0005EEC0EB|nr:hypothetical protein [Acetobacter tropicalis]KXV51643.1 hypothetical protein AD944_01200 [Acetobacter tropicalis]
MSEEKIPNIGSHIETETDMLQTIREQHNLIRILKRDVRFYFLSLVVSTFIIVFVCFSSFALFEAESKSNEFDHKLPATSLMWLGMGSLIFDGPITESAYKNLDASLNTGLGHKVTTLAINSPGGDGHAAEKIATLLNQRGIEITIFAEGSCGSACVPLFIHTHKHSSLDNGLIIFHQGFIYRSDALHGILAMAGLSSDKGPVYMDKWAGELGTPLLAYLRSCTLANPLRSPIGIAMTWQEIQDVLQGHAQRSCDAAMVDYECKRADAPSFCNKGKPI